MTVSDPGRRRLLTAAAAGGATLACGAWSWPFATRESQHESLLIAGTAAMKQTTALLADAFTRQYPVEVVNEGGSTAAGLIALHRGAIDIAAVARELKRSEEGIGLRTWLFAKDALALVVSPDNPVRDLTRQQVRDILSGVIANWKDVGGPNQPIEVINRPAAATTRAWVEENILDGREIVRRARPVANAKRVAPIVAANPRAIGYVATRSVSDAVVTLTVDGVGPSRNTIYSGRYPFTRPLYYATRETPPPVVRKFLDFVRSTEGQELMEPDLMRVC